MTWFAEVYRALLRLMPVEFQRRYGRDAVELAVMRVGDARGLRRVTAVGRELTDLVATAGRERAADRTLHRLATAGRSRAGSFEAIARDVRTSLRSLRATPGFTAVALVILTLGIGASTAIFSVVDAVVLRGLPFDESDRIVAVGRMSPDSIRPGVESAQTLFDWMDQQDVFDQMAATAGTIFTALDGGEPESLNARRVTTDLFSLLRVQPAMGRVFTQDELDRRARVVLLSDGLWRRRFGADPHVLGRTIATDNGAWQVVGVMPPGFNYPIAAGKAAVDVWVPFAPGSADRSRTGVGRNFMWTVIGRLKPGVTVAMAKARIQQITDALAAQYPDWFKDAGAIGVVPLRDALVGGVRSWMMLLLAAVALVLLIACVNVANLMLARATSRERELAVRAALGGTRWQLARGLLVESLMLSAVGTAGGVLLAKWGVAILKASMPGGVPRVASVAVDLRVLAVAALAATVTGMLFGLAPAIQGSRTDVTQSLRDGGRSATAGIGRQRLRGGLVIAEVTLAVLLLVGAGLFISSFVRFTSVDLGIDMKNVFTISAYLNYRDPSWRERGRPMVADVLSRLQKLPGVEAVAGVDNGLPLSGSWSRGPMSRPGRPAIDEGDGAFRHDITPGYFTVMRIPFLRGRGFTDADSATSERVAIINDVAARRYFPGEDPIGQTIEIDTTNRVIVGIVRGVRVVGPTSDIGSEVYRPLMQSEVGGADFAIRTYGDPEAVRESAKAAIRQVRPEQTFPLSGALEMYFDTLAAQRKFNMLLLGLFGLLGIVIAGVGIYGVMAYIVAQRTPEIGIRMALGAAPAQILGDVLTRATSYVAIGLALGLAGAWGLAHFVQRFLFEVQPHDRVVYGAVAAVLLAAGLVAALIPARRAARVDPIVALRAE
jgi:putative ABC transport system permease protein